MNANASDVRIDPTGFDHQLITSIMDFLAGSYKGVEVRKDLVGAGLTED